MAQAILLIVSGTPLATLGGYLYGTPGMYEHVSYPVVALHTAIALWLLCMAGLFARADAGLMAIATSDSLAGAMSRKLLPAAIGLPLATGLAVLSGERAGLYTAAFGSALLVACCALLFAGAVTWTVTVLWNTERERTRTEQKVGEGEQRLRIALETAHLGSFQLNPATGVLEGSAQYKANFGLAPADPFSYQAAVAAVQEDDRMAMLASLSAASADKTDYHAEYRVRWADGSEHWIVSSGRGVSGEDGTLQIVGVTLDVTSKKSAEAERERLLNLERAARAEAEKANRLKDEFLSVVSHELRTPLNAILGWAQILRSDPTDTEEVTAGLETIERNARSQSRIIEDILDMSRAINGKLRLDVQRVDLPAVITAAAESMRPAADAKGVRLVTVLDPSAGPISGDPNRLQQIVWNLLSNAIRFTPKTGRVQVELTRVQSQVQISVTDSGEGISAEFLPNVFERFRQADSSSTRRHGGLGLGLAIVKNLVELHGGRVSAESAGIGLGSTFRITLPLMAVQAESLSVARRPTSIATAEKSLPELDGVRVLVVDDEADSRELVGRLLRACEATATLAGSVDEAMTVLGEGRFDLIISDIGMPGRDGYDLIRNLRSMPEKHGGKTPAVALTAYARSEDRVKAMVAGFDMHVAKPVDPGELRAVVARLAGR